MQFGDLPDFLFFKIFITARFKTSLSGKNVRPQKENNQEGVKNHTTIKMSWI